MLAVLATALHFAFFVPGCDSGTCAKPMPCPCRSDTVTISWKIWAPWPIRWQPIIVGSGTYQIGSRVSVTVQLPVTGVAVDDTTSRLVAVYPSRVSTTSGAEITRNCRIPWWKIAPR